MIEVRDRRCISRGLPEALLRARPFNLEDYVCAIDSQIPGQRPQRIGKLAQTVAYAGVKAAPHLEPYIYCIGETPGDTRAKCVAGSLMESAYNAQLGGGVRHITQGQQLPLWHTVNGSYRDVLRDGSGDSPSLLVLSGIAHDCTATKLEKVRDLCEQFATIPRIIIIAGGEPLTWANSRLHLGIQHALYLSNARTTQL